MINVTVGGGFKYAVLFYFESLFSTLPVTAPSHVWVTGSSLNRLMPDLRTEFVCVCLEGERQAPPVAAAEWRPRDFRTRDMQTLSDVVEEC